MQIQVLRSLTWTLGAPLSIRGHPDPGKQSYVRRRVPVGVYRRYRMPSVCQIDDQGGGGSENEVSTIAYKRKVAI
jgi:hypothetical protein